MTTALTTKRVSELEKLLNMYIILKNEWEIANQDFLYKSGMYDNNFCRIVKLMKLDFTSETLLLDDMREHRTNHLGPHWFNGRKDRERFLNERIEELRRELSLFNREKNININKLKV